MNIRLILTWIICFFSSIVNPAIAQSDIGFAPVGAKWHYQIWPFDFPYRVNYTSFSCTGDTIINGKSCSQITIGASQWGSYSGLSNPFFLHYDSNQVFWFNQYSNQFNLLYDFNADIGESWTIKLQCDTTFPIVWSDSLVVTVTNVSSMNVNGNSLKVLHLDNFSTIVEGIGSLGTPYPEITSCTGIWVDPTAHPIRCYRDTVIGFFRSSLNLPCDTTYNLPVGIEASKPSFIRVSPNPVKDILRIDFDIEVPGKKLISGFNSSGQLVLQNSFQGNTYSLDISYLPAGIYSIHIVSEYYQTNKRILKP